MRDALGTLPWVEQETIQMNFQTRELRFGLKDRSQFNAAAVQNALKTQGFAEVAIQSTPA